MEDRLSFSKASQEEVEKIAASLGYHLVPEIQAAFKDKVERYTRKKDRDVIIGSINKQFTGYCMVIAQMEPPDSLSPEIFMRLSTYGCITGLGVNPEWRKRGIGANLVREGISWMEYRNLPGLWLRTRVMAEWYEKHLGFMQVGTMIVKQSIVKAVLAKAL